MIIWLSSQVVFSKQPKLGLTQEFVVLLVRMCLNLSSNGLTCHLQIYYLAINYEQFNTMRYGTVN